MSLRRSEMCSVRDKLFFLKNSLNRGNFYFFYHFVDKLFLFIREQKTHFPRLTFTNINKFQTKDVVNFGN